MLERYVRFIVRHRVAVIVASLAITAFFAAELRHLRFEIRRQAQLPQDHPYVRIQNQITEQFGGETTLVIGVIAKQGDIFTPAILQKIVRITRELELVPGIVPGSLLSIASPHVKIIAPGAEALDLRSPFEEGVPSVPEDVATVKQQILGDDIYSGILVARDGTAAAIIADFDETLTDMGIYTAVRQVIDGEADDLVHIAIGGSPMVRVYSAQYTRTMVYLFPLAVLVIALIHYEAFRTVQATVLPLMTALLAVTWSLGIIGLLDQPMDTWSSITPIIVLAIAAGHAVQILKRYYEEIQRAPSGDAAIIRSICAVGPVMLTAGIIAAAGFASLATFGVASVQTFGLLLAGGILSALIIELTFIPACRALLPLRSSIHNVRPRQRLHNGALHVVERAVLIHPWKTLVVAGSIVCVSLIQTSNLAIDNSLRAWFPEQSQLRVDDRILNDRLAGTSTLYLLLEGTSAGDLEKPEVLRAILDLQSWLKQQPEIGATVSIADFIRRIHAAMSPGADPTQQIPDSPRLISQYMFLYSFAGPDSLDHLVDSERRLGVLRAYSKTDGADFASQLFERLQTFAAGRFQGLSVQPRIAGGALGVQAALNQEIVHDKMLNVVQVGLVIFLLSSLVLRSVSGGLLVLVPLAVAVSVSLGTMAVTRTPLSLATATFTAMAIGIAADFAIYVVFRLREELVCANGRLSVAMRATLQTSGAAVLFVSLAVVLGYLVLSLSGFRVWVYLGWLTALMVTIAALGALTVIPALVVVARPGFLWRGILNAPELMDSTNDLMDFRETLPGRARMTAENRGHR